MSAQLLYIQRFSSMKMETLHFSRKPGNQNLKNWRVAKQTTVLMTVWIQELIMQSLICVHTQTLLCAFDKSFNQKHFLFFLLSFKDSSCLVPHLYFFFPFLKELSVQLFCYYIIIVSWISCWCSIFFFITGENLGSISIIMEIGKSRNSLEIQNQRKNKQLNNDLTQRRRRRRKKKVMRFKNYFEIKANTKPIKHA